MAKNKHIYKEDFYKRPTKEVACDLIGSLISRALPNGEVVSGHIVEVEAYTANDPACHAYNGITKRTQVLFGPPGHAYVYFIYGMYFCLNVVTEPVGIPGAVLIRAVSYDGCDGPGKLCRAWQITNKQNGLSLMEANSELWIESGLNIKPTEIQKTKRIGIKKATHLEWRYYLKNSPYVSKK